VTEFESVPYSGGTQGKRSAPHERPVQLHGEKLEGVFQENATSFQMPARLPLWRVIQAHHAIDDEFGALRAWPAGRAPGRGGKTRCPPPRGRLVPHTNPNHDRIFPGDARQESSRAGRGGVHE
jgi:hypothetical protein